jgi:glycosyltransferase involved in cell wall biosynthesis
MKILLLNHGPLEATPVLRNLASFLQEQGHSVSVAAYVSQPPSRTVATEAGVVEYAVHRGGDRVPIRPLRGIVRLSRFGWAARKIVRETRPAVVVAFFFDSLALAHLLSGGNTRVVYYALEYSPRPGLRDFWTGWGFLKLLEGRLARRAGLLVSVEEGRAAKQAEDWRSATPMVVRNSPRLEPRVERAAELRLAAPAEPPVRLVYAGGVYENTMIAELVEAVGDTHGVSLDVYGPVRASYRERFDNALADADSRQGGARYCGSLDYAELSMALTQYDVGVVLYRPGESIGVNYQLPAPSKLLEYMKSGLAVIATPQPFMQAVVEDTQAGWLVEGDVPAGLRTLLTALAADPGEVRARGERGLRAFSDRLSYDVGAQKLADALGALAPD